MGKSQPTYTKQCDYCGAIIKTTRKWQRFCGAPKKCRELWWKDKKRREGQIRKMVFQHDKDLKKIKKHLGITQ